MFQLNKSICKIVIKRGVRYFYQRVLRSVVNKMSCCYEGSIFAQYFANEYRHISNISGEGDRDVTR